MELAFLQMLASKAPGVATAFVVLGTLVVLGQIIVQLTPSKADDAAWEKIKGVPFLGNLIVALTSFAVIQKK
jgi:hypothetical protein